MPSWKPLAIGQAHRFPESLYADCTTALETKSAAGRDHVVEQGIITKTSTNRAVGAARIAAPPMRDARETIVESAAATSRTAGPGNCKDGSNCTHRSQRAAIAAARRGSAEMPEKVRALGASSDDAGREPCYSSGMAKNTATTKHAKTGSFKKISGSSGRSEKSGKSLAASVLSQQPATKRAHISQADADRAVGAYLSRTKK